MPERLANVRRRPRRLLIGAGAFTAAAVALALFPLITSNASPLPVVTKPDTHTVLLTHGAVDMKRLAVALDEAGYADVLAAAADDSWLLRQTLVVGAGASLEVDDSELRLASNSGGPTGLEARGGSLTIRDSTVTSWDPSRGAPDKRVEDGRAWVMAVDGGTMDVVGSHMMALGYDSPGRYGVTWRGGGTRGMVLRSAFTGNFYGAYTVDTLPMVVRQSVFEDSVRYGLDAQIRSTAFVIEGNDFRRNGSHGLVLHEGGPSASVRDNRSYANTRHGILLFTGSHDAVLTGNEVYDNRGTGIEISGSDRAVLKNNLAYANDVGVSLDQGASDARIVDNRLTANRTDGLRVSARATGIRVTGNRMDFNYRAGLFVEGGAANVQSNQLTNNVVGAWLADASAAELLNNLITRNADGVHLVSQTAPTIRGNTFRDNYKATFSVTRLGNALPYILVNRIVQGAGPLQRVRGA